MTAERWRQIEDLFNTALQHSPSERVAWLRGACGDDEGLRAEVTDLLDQDARVARDGFLVPPEVAKGRLDVTPYWVSGGNGQALDGTGLGEHAGASTTDEADGFTPKPAIHAGMKSHPSVESRSLPQQRLRELTIIYLLITLLMVCFRFGVVGDPDLTQAIPYSFVLAALGGGLFVLSRGKPLAPGSLKMLELGMIVAVAGVFAFAQYQSMLTHSLRNDPTRAQLIMKNRVLVTAVLILSYGIYVPKSWRRVALVVGPLAFLPFAVLAALYIRHPETMGWLARTEREDGTAPFVLLGVDAMILLILAAGSAFGAHTISRLRQQVMEARQLGQYRLRRLLGAGGMGEVYLAEHQLLKRPCALKLIRLGVESGSKALARFEREVRLTAALSHPNTVEIYDYGRTEDGTYYYVMEYLRGLSLAELVERHGPLPAGRAVHLLRQVCLALREAHGAGLIHRDIKPSNIFASRRGGTDDVAKLFDFGLVLPLSKFGAAHESGEGRIFGTPLFMSPEQATGERAIDGRSDIYSLGAVAYYLLTGRPPFEGANGIGLLIAHAHDPVVPPSHIRAGIPEDLERVVLRCLAKDAADRYQDAQALERALGDCGCAGDWDHDRAARWWRETEHAAVRMG
jgi:eukaryotic-like serine/threonine-protein kinase